MLPKTHILLGAVFALALYFIFPAIPLYALALIFFSSFLIDFDHYLSAIAKTSSFNLKKTYDYHIEEGKIALRDRKKGIRKKGDFHIFHTIEFILLVFLFSFFWKPAIYVFIGMIFHSVLDIIYLINRDLVYRREFFLFNWIRKRLTNR